MGNRLREVALEEFLSTNASSPNYVQSLDSYLYNVYGAKKGLNKVRFLVQVVDVNGVSLSYTLNGQTIIGIELTVSPASMNVNMAKMVNRTQTMTAWIEDHWGEELDTITFQGSTAAFIWGGPTDYIPQSQGPLNMTSEEIRNMFNQYANLADLGTSQQAGPGDHSGLTVNRRRETPAYDDLRRMLQLMHTNTATFDIYGLVKDRRYVQLQHDYACYRGYFESFDVTENADTPYKFIYTITFKAEKTIYSFLG